MVITTLRTLRSRLGVSVAAFLVLFVASAVLTACGVLMESGLRAGVPTERYAGAPLVITGLQAVPHGDADELLPERVGVPAAMTSRLAQVDGVTAAVGDHIIPIHLDASADPRPVWGHGWRSARLTPFELREGHPPDDAEVVIDEALADRAKLDVGSPLAIATRLGSRRYLVSGIAAGPVLQQQAAVFFSDREAAALAVNAARVAAIGILPAEGTSVERLRTRLQTVLGDTPAAVLTGDDRGRPEFLMATAGSALVVAVAGTFGGLAAAIAIFVVAATASLSVQLRQRELGLLRAVAATPRQVRLMIITEAGLLATVAGAIGWAPGLTLTGALRSAFQDRGLVPATFQLAVGPLPFVISLGTTVLVAALASMVAGTRASKVHPTTALAEAAVEPRRLGWLRVTLGVITLAGMGVLLGVALSAGGDVAVASSLGPVFGVSLGVALLGPVVTGIPALLLALPLRMFPVVGHLAAVNLRAGSRRLASVVAPLMLAIGFTATGLYTEASAARAADQQREAGTLAEYALTGSVLPVGVAERARNLPGVVGATALYSTGVVSLATQAGEVDPQVHTAYGVTALGEPALDPAVTTGDLGQLRGDTVALSGERAAAFRVEVGEPIHLLLGDGSAADLTVVAVYRRDLGFPDVILPGELVAAHSTTGLPSAVLVRAAPGADASRLRAELQFLAAAHPGVSLGDRDMLRRLQAEEQELDLWLSYVIVGMLSCLVAITVVNTLVIATAERHRELALLRLMGLSRSRALLMIAAEAWVLALTALTFGAGAALSTLVPVSLALTGQPVPNASPAGVLGIAGTTVAVALLTTTGTALVMLRQSPTQAIGARS